MKRILRRLSQLVKPAWPRIAVVGSCQAHSIGGIAQAMLPNASIKAWHVDVWPIETQDEILAQMSGFDLIISQVSDLDPHDKLWSGSLRQTGVPVIHMPMVGFTGFQPDITYIFGPEGPVRGVGSDYHSILVATAFALGVPEHRVPMLFNTYVFAELGYLEVFQPAKAALLESYAAVGFDIAGQFEQWLRECGAFMYSVNHPHIHVLKTLTRMVLHRAGYVAADAPLPDGVEDYLGTAFRVPVFPPIALRVGVAGSTTYSLSRHDVEHGANRDLALHDFAAASYRLYEGVDRELLLATGGVAEARRRLDPLIVR